MREEGAQVRSMFTPPGQTQLVKHMLVHEVCTAGDRGKEPATSDDGMQIASVYLCAGERRLDLCESKLLLIQNTAVAERFQLGIGVAQDCRELGMFVHVQRDFRGGRAGINGQNFKAGRQR